MQILLVVLLFGAIIYSLLSIIAARGYLATRPVPTKDFEPVSILKPLSGLDLGLESNLRTFFEQDYPSFEILFAVRSADDPAVAVVEKLQREYPQVDSRLLITGEPPYTNAKVYSLDRMLRDAKNEFIVMSDSDTRVTSEFLTAIAAEFQNPEVGIVTCPYRAKAGPGLWSNLEVAGMNTDFVAGILVARLIEGMRFAVGPTIAARRTAIESIGGFNKLKDYLAEDFMMGRLAWQAGFGVILSSYVIEHHIGGSGLRKSAAHRLRWVRSTRRSRPQGYIGQVFTMPLPIALALWAVAPEWWPASAAAILVRFVAAWVASAIVLRARLNWLLLPVEDLLEFIFWMAGFFGNTIDWRGRRYRLHADGRFEPLVEAAPTYAAPEFDPEA